MQAVPHGHHGRIGAEYEFYGERWKLHRVGPDEDRPYIFRTVGRRSAYIMMTARRFLKAAGAAARRVSCRPCFQCLAAIPSDGASLHCAPCCPEPHPRAAWPFSPLEPFKAMPQEPEPVMGQLSLF